MCQVWNTDCVARGSQGAAAPYVTSAFSAAVRRLRTPRSLVVQPRMGFSSLHQMRSGLRAVSSVPGAVGTITLDSFTRTEQYETARSMLRAEQSLNGYPLLAHSAQATAGMVGEFDQAIFPIQLRHGSPRPHRIFRAMLRSGLTATEGGPVSYCLPYGRTPLNTAVSQWARSCELLAGHNEVVHLESFAGCMLGQLCPPSLLVALGILESLFATSHGVRSISLSYAQQTDFWQDLAAVTALRRLASRFLGGTDWHLVIYTYMGVFPRSVRGARRLLQLSALLAQAARAHRLVVKTLAEAHNIPTIDDNVQALQTAAAVPVPPQGRLLGDQQLCDEIHDEALGLIHTVLDLRPTIASSILAAFKAGLLDVPYCLHPDNANSARSFIDGAGRLAWAQVGRMPIGGRRVSRVDRVSSGDLLAMLSHVQRTYDGEPASTFAERLVKEGLIT